jgi:hypothetical protein
MKIVFWWVSIFVLKKRKRKRKTQKTENKRNLTKLTSCCKADQQYWWALESYGSLLW